MALRQNRSIALALLTVHLAACAPWRPQPTGPVTLAGPKGPSAVFAVGEPGWTTPEALQPQAVDEDGFWEWVDAQKWYIALGAVILFAIIVAATDDDCAPGANYCYSDNSPS